jgi:hypothetical protein
MQSRVRGDSRCSVSEAQAAVLLRLLDEARSDTPFGLCFVVCTRASINNPAIWCANTTPV